ncbi:tetratricopeptide repeat protein [Streptomyces sp. NPDC054794]
MDSALSAAGDPLVQVLCGMGGSGKTSIALELVRHRLGRAQVWWVDARQDTTLEAGLRAVARQAGASEEQLRTGAAADVLWSCLARFERPWLLVVDNADEPALLDGPGRLSEGTGWIRPPANGLGSVLVTSRDSTPQTWGTACTRHPVRPLTGDHFTDAEQILRDHAGDGAGPADDARRLAERLGGLPLALRLAGTYLADAGNVPPAYREPGTPVDFHSYQEALDRGLAHVDQGNVIAQTWAMSVRLLEQRGLPLAQPLLQLIATFADAPLPYTLLLTPQTLSTAEGLAGLEGPGLWRLLTALAALGLVDLSPATDTNTLPTLRVHPLVRDASLDQGVLGTAVSALHSAAAADRTGRPEDPGYWDHWRLLHPHGLDLFQRATATELPDETVQDAARTAWLAARYLRVRGLYDRARSELEAVLAAQRKILGDTHPGTLATRHSLASARHDQGDLSRARSEFEAVLAARRELLGDTHSNTLTTWHDLALVLREQGEVGRARREFEAILTAEREIHGDTHPSTLPTRHELALVLHDQGEVDRARREFEAILTAERATLGDTHPDTLATRHNLASVLHDQGEVDRARREFEAILTAQRKTLGDTHPGTLATRHRLALILHEQGEVGRARREFEAILAAQRKTLGDTHPDTLATRHSLASVLREQGEVGRARREFEAVLAARRETLGDTHPATLNARHSLASVLREQGEVGRARREFEAVLAARRETLGDTHPDTLNARRSLHQVADASQQRNAATEA